MKTLKKILQAIASFFVIPQMEALAGENDGSVFVPDHTVYCINPVLDPERLLFPVFTMIPLSDSTI